MKKHMRKVIVALTLQIVCTAFASSLSSSEIGTFFTLPAWMPREVSSYNTPGSDPEDRSGWYVDEYTNVVSYSNWTVRSAEDGDVVPDYEPSFMESSQVPGMYGWDVFTIPGWVESWVMRKADARPGYDVMYMVPEPGFFEDRYGTMTELAWHYRVHEYNENPPHDEIDVFVSVVASRTRTEMPAPTGRRVPRASRLTPEIQASIYATFEGVCERMYYASQGQENRWPVSEYGPLTAREFVFPDLLPPPELTYLNPTNYYVYWPTNRTISTRRLVEYDNLMNLFGDIPVDERYDRYFGRHIRHVHFDTYRPNWVTDNRDGGMGWSTTASSLPDVFVPEFDWRYGIRPVSNEWSGALATFRDLHDVQGVWTTYSKYDSVYNFLHNVYFMQHAWDEDTSNIGWGNTNRLTMADVIEANYPGVSGCAITNTTRRLFSDALCCANQVIGLADRTILIPGFSYAWVGTNEQYTTDRRYRGDVTFSLSKRPDTSLYDVRFGSIDWNYQADTNYTVGVMAEGSGSGQIARRFSGTQTSAGATISIKGGGGFFTPDDATAAHIIELASLDGVVFSPGEQVTISIDSFVTDAPYVNLNIYTSFSGWSHYGYSVMDDPTSTVARVFCNYTRKYTYVRATGESTLYATQPGRDAGDRAGKTVAAVIVGVHNRPEYYTSSMWSLPTHEDGLPPFSQFLYKTKLANPATRQDVQDLLAFAEQEGYKRFRLDLGVEPIANFDIIAIDGDDAESVKRSVSLNGITTASISVLCPLVYIQGIITDSGGIAVNAVLSEDPETHQYVPGYLPLFTVAFDTEPTHDQPSANEIRAFSSDTRFSLVTRTDWNWKCLKRTDE